MRVLHYCQSFSPLSETFIYDYIIELEKQETENYVVTHNRLNNEDRPFERVTVIETPGRWHPGKLIQFVNRAIYKESLTPLSWPLIRKRISAVVEEINPEVIHAHFGPSGIIIAPIANKLNISLIVSFHGYDAFSLTKEQFWINQYQEKSNLISVVTCVSECMKKHLSEILLDTKLKVIHVGKNLDDYPFKKPEGEIKNWLSIGRIAEKKGHDDTIRAFGKILHIDPNQNLRIIGDGKKIDQYQQLIEELDISESVKLLGALPHNEVKTELNKADAFILASKTAPNGDKEGIPTVLMEAQAMGLPCVSTKHSGIPEVFPTNNHQFLSEEGNVRDIAQKIEALMNCSKAQLEEIASRGRKKIEEEFNLVKEVEELINLYEEVNTN